MADRSRRDGRHELAERYRDVPLRVELLIALVLCAAAFLALWLSSGWWSPPYGLGTLPLTLGLAMRWVGRYYYRRGFADDNSAAGC